MRVHASPSIEGSVSRGFEGVREAFADNFASRGGLGGACCAYHRGEKVVDLCGGVRNKQTGDLRDIALRDALYRALGVS